MTHSGQVIEPKPRTGKMAQGLKYRPLLQRTKVGFQHSHGSASLTIIPVSRDATPSSVLGEHQTYIWHIEIHVGKTLIYTK